MQEPTEQQFLEWFNELEGFALRSERFFDTIDAVQRKLEAPDNVRHWLLAAYRAGWHHGVLYALDAHQDWQDTQPDPVEPDPNQVQDVKYQISLLKDFPRVQSMLERVWGTKRGRDYIHGLVLDSREDRYHSKVQGFPEHVYETIANLLAIHDGLFPEHKPPQQPWDVYTK